MPPSLAAESGRNVETCSTPVLNIGQIEEKRLFAVNKTYEPADFPKLSEIFSRLENSPLAQIFPDTRDEAEDPLES